MNEQHERADRPGAEERAELQALKSTLEAGVRRICLRIDHATGKHERVVQEGCPSCPL